jgi:putative phosphoesterase
VKIALLGDIHGNSAALRAVLDAAVRQDVDTLLITGDLVGYYFDPLGVVEMLARWRAFIVRGNHEDMLAAVRADPERLGPIEQKYGSGLRVALETLSLSELNALCALPHPLMVELGGLRILLCHGAPWDNDAYVYPDADDSTLGRCASTGYDLVVMGHTHHPFVRERSGVRLVNPGSVGQPRNRRHGAQWALVDTETLGVALHSEPYDYVALAAEARRRHPELPYLAQVLTR